MNNRKRVAVQYELQPFFLYVIGRIKFFKLAECVDFDNVVEGTFSDSDFVLGEVVLKGNLVPIAFFSSGSVIDGNNVFRKLFAVLVVPI